MKIKIILILFITAIFTSCSTTKLIQSSSKNPPGNETVVDKTTKIVLSVSNDKQGILLNFSIPNLYDQYKVLKYGAHLYVNMRNKNTPEYEIAYPLSNYNKALRLPIVSAGDTSFHFEKLLYELNKENSPMNLMHFYSIDQLNIAPRRRDSVSVQLFNSDTQNHVLIYSAFIPYNSIPEFNKNQSVNELRIGFASNSLDVPGLNDEYGPTLDLPRQRKRGNYKPQPDIKVVRKLAEPIFLWTKVKLASQ